MFSSSFWAQSFTFDFITLLSSLVKTWARLLYRWIGDEEGSCWPSFSSRLEVA